MYIDPRLEVAGADLFRRYTALEKRIKDRHARVGSRAGRDGAAGHPLGPSLQLRDRRNAVSERPLALRLVRRHRAVFVHDSFGSEVRADTVDFAARHFRPDPSRESRDRAELIASSKAIAKYVILLGSCRRRESASTRLARAGRHAGALAARARFGRWLDQSGRDRAVSRAAARAGRTIPRRVRPDLRSVDRARHVRTSTCARARARQPLAPGR